MKGDIIVPLFFTMTNVLEKIKLLAEPLLEGSDMFIVNIKDKPTNNIKLFIDADLGLSISKSATLNKALSKAIEEEQLFPEGDFSLEVSSPGVDEPLTSTRQYKKNIGRKLLLELDEEVEKLGVLKEVSDTHVVLEIKGSKKKEATIEEVAFDLIKKATVQISF